METKSSRAFYVFRGSLVHPCLPATDMSKHQVGGEAAEEKTVTGIPACTHT